MKIGLSFVLGVIIGACGIWWAKNSGSHPPNEPVPSDVAATAPSAPAPDDTGAQRDLAQLRAEVTRLRQEKVETASETNKIHSQQARLALEATPQFEHKFLARESWTNVGLGSPLAALQTYFWALTSSDSSSLASISAVASEGVPVTLTGMRSDFAEQLQGVQLLSMQAPDPQNLNVLDAFIIAEINSGNANGGARSHSALKLRFVRHEDGCRFAGRVR